MSNDRIEGFFPIAASARFYAERPSDWLEMSDELRKQYFIENMHRDATVCHHCAQGLETDFDPDLDFIDKIANFTDYVSEY